MKNAKTPADSVGGEIPHGWCVYLALADAGDRVLMRVGSAVNPVDRIAELHLECPYTIAAARVAGVEDRGQAKRIEGRILKSVHDLAKNTRGHWFEVDPESIAHKHRITKGFNLLFQVETGRDPVWLNITGETIAQAARLLGRKKAS